MAKNTNTAEALVGLVRQVTKTWATQRKAEERHASARLRRDDRMWRQRGYTFKEAADQVMAKAYAHASDNGKLPANARQIMYAARPSILEITGKDQMSDKYFTQQLLPDYIEDHYSECSNWDVVYDARGTFTEPHTNVEVGLGTIEVRDYLRGTHRGQTKRNVGGIEEDPQFPTLGPERFDIAIMSTKGVSVTAARRLLDRLDRSVDQILVLHDFDVSGFTICGTLARSSRRYHFTNQVEIIDIGLRLADVEAMNLQSEPVSDRADWRSRAITLRRHGATSEEIDFLQENRVELNAMSSRQFVDHLEAKFAEHGVTKVLPEKAILEGHARYLLEVLIANQELEKILPLVREQAAAQKLPADLRSLVAKQFEKTPAWAWDRAVVDLVKRLPPPKPRRKKTS